MVNDLKKDYFEWMYHKVCDGRFAKENSHRKLLSYLNSVEFTWILDADATRAEDGEEGLRRTYTYENNIESRRGLDGPCTVLELILNMAYRCEEIMDDATMGDRTVQWFWQMITNLGLGGMADRRYDQEYVAETVDRFLNRDFEPDGHGSLFVIRNCKTDLRDVPIWTSMLWYLDTMV
nr:hypothetical protein [uncultured Mediterraneibacter sp.]